MNAKKCDVCGRLYEVEQALVTVDDKRVTSIDFFNEYVSGSYNTIASLDLCHRCMVAVCRVLEKRGLKTIKIEEESEG